MWYKDSGLFKDEKSKKAVPKIINSQIKYIANEKKQNIKLLSSLKLKKYILFPYVNNLANPLRNIIKYSKYLEEQSNEIS